MNYGFIGEVIGADDIYIAEVLEDSLATFTVDTPKLLVPTASIAEATTMNQTPSYYSNQALWVYNSEGASVLTLVTPYLNAETEAYLLGKQFDAATGRELDSGKPKARYFALGFRSEMSEDQYMYVWWAKGAFAIPSQNRGQTKTDSVSPQQLTINYTSITTIHKFDMPDGSKDGIKKVQGDTTNTTFSAVNWFDAVQLPAATAQTYTVTVVPDNAVNGSVTVTPTGPQAAGTVLTLAATAEAGFAFDNWTSDAGGTFANANDASTTFTTPASNVTVTANFI